MTSYAKKVEYKFLGISEKCLIIKSVLTCQCPPRLVQQVSMVYACGVLGLTVAVVEQDSTLSHIQPENQTSLSTLNICVL